jgi:hypothetical protein
MTAAAHKVAVLLRAPAAGIIDHVQLFTGTVTVGGTLKISFQGVSATTGDPDGTATHYRTMVIADTDDNIWKVSAKITNNGTDGGSQRTFTKGELFFIVVEFNTFGGTENLNIQGGRTINNIDGTIQDYLDLFTTVWTKNSTAAAIFLPVYSGGVIYPLSSCCITNATVAAVTFNSGSTPDEIGNHITIPFVCKVDGIYISVDTDADCEVVLYDTDGTTPLFTATLDKDIRPSTFGGVYILPFDEITLTLGGVYRVVCKPGGTNMSIYYIQVQQPEHRTAYSSGNYVQYTSRTNAGAWAQTDTRMTIAGFRISALSDVVTAGGGGGMGISKSRVYGGM